MDRRNPSHAGKSEKEKQYFRQRLKRISSEDTAPIKLPFEASDVSSDDSSLKKSAKRPQPLGRKIGSHLKKNSATYITCIITLAFTSLVIPFVGLNREVGELKSDFSYAKGALIEFSDFKKREMNNQGLIERIGEELAAVKYRLETIDSRVLPALNSITSIRTYLANKFKAKID